MKQFSLYIITILLLVGTWSCADEVGDYTVFGEAISKYELVDPKSNDTIIINAGALDETVLFKWNDAESGLGSPVVYTLIIYKEGGSVDTPLWKKLSDNDGSENKATISFSELKDIYDEGKGVGSETANLLWTIQSENGSPNVKTAQVSYSLKIKLSEDGLTNFSLISPVNNSLLSINGSLENELVAFEWDPSVSSSGNDVRYRFLMDVVNGDFSSPLISIDSDNGGLATSIEKTHGDWKTLFEQKDIKDGAYQWTIEASTSGIQWNKQVNKLFVEFINWRKPIYIVGDATDAGWDIGNALEMNFVAPNLWTGVFNLTDTKEFKFFPVKGSWDNGIGADRFTDFVNCEALANGNIKVTTGESGGFIVVVDLNAKFVSVFKAPYLVGGSTIVGWNTGSAYPLRNVSKGVYETYEYVTVEGSGFKFLPTKDWKGDFGKSKTIAGILAQADEDNITVPSDGFYRIRADFNDMTYSVELTNWGIVGSATSGQWDSSTPMTLTSSAKGQYTWSVDADLSIGELKFRANDTWDINLGDNNADGSMEYGGTNISISAEGNYHIELILNSQTGYSYSITAN